MIWLKLLGYVKEQSGINYNELWQIPIIDFFTYYTLFQLDMEEKIRIQRQEQAKWKR